MVFGFSTSTSSSDMLRPHRETMLASYKPSSFAKRAPIDSPCSRRRVGSPSHHNKKLLSLQRRNNSGSTVDVTDDDRSHSSHTMPPPLAMITASSSCSWTALDTSLVSEQQQRRQDLTAPVRSNSQRFLSRIRKRPTLFNKSKRSLSLQDGKPPLMKTRVRVGDDGGVETFYYNSNELDYSDDEHEESDRTGGHSRCVSVGGYCSSEAGTGLSSSLNNHVTCSFNKGLQEEAGFEEDDDDDSLCGSMYFVNNESTLLEFSPEELVNPHRTTQQQQPKQPKRRLSLTNFRSSRTVY